MVGETMNTTQICSNKETARSVRGNEEEDAVNWAIAQKNKMEKTTAVWGRGRGDVVTMRVVTNDEDKPTRVVQGTVTRKPSETLHSLDKRQYTK